MNILAFTIFLIIVGLTLVITYFASKRTKTTSDFYTADSSLTGWQNGTAIAGDYMSAASFLGIAGMIAARFSEKKVRGVAALNTVTISIFYMIAQLVGVGALIKLLLGIDYFYSVLIVGILMTVYVVFGGMRATSWVQIVKAMLLIVGTLIISIIVFAKFDFSVFKMFDQIKTLTPLGNGYLNPGNKFKIPLDTISLNLALVLGTAGIPHILTRFFTVKDAITAS